MATFIKAQLKKSDDQTKIDKYRVAANITEYNIKINLPKNHNFKIHIDKANISCKDAEINKDVRNFYLKFF